jgi:hypothetical protein
MTVRASSPTHAARMPRTFSDGYWTDSWRLSPTPTRRRYAHGAQQRRLDPHERRLHPHRAVRGDAGLPAVTVPTVNPDNNQHSPNENLRVGHFVEGIAIIVAVLQQPLE